MADDAISATSRYAQVERANFTTADGRVLRYLRRRFLPRPGTEQVLAEHRVVLGDRPDILAARYLGDPEQLWRICDANGVMHPRELTRAVGSVVRITMPGGGGR